MRNALSSLRQVAKIKFLGIASTSFYFWKKAKGSATGRGMFFLRQIDEIRFLSPRIPNFIAGYNFRKQ